VETILMDIVDLDIETYSDVELKKANVYAYTESEAFDILMCGWGVNDGPVDVDCDPARIRDLILQWTTDPGVKLVAHNAPFERICFSRSAGMPVGQYLPPEQWYDTMAIAALHGLPRKLDALARRLQLTPKDSAGTRLINLFSKPYRGRRVFAHEKPVQWQEFVDYCVQDVLTMREARHAMPGWPADGFERELWYVDQRINDRGMRVDLDLARGAVGIAKENTATTEREVIEITSVENPGSVPQLREWCESAGFPLPNMTATTVTDALTRSYLPPAVRRVLELRQELALVAHRKFEAALRGVSCDGRLRGQFMYHAAHTGRWSARGVQLHNLARLAFTYKDAEGEKHYDEVWEDAAIIAISGGRNVPPEILKMSVRPMFILDGVSSDFSAIEARVLAWLAGEDWVLKAFLEGRDLYVENADRMGAGMGRGDGKIAVLAGGYQGSVGSYRNMGYGGRRCPFDTARQLKVKDPRDGREYDKEFQDVAEHAAKVAVTEGHIHEGALAAYLDKAERKHYPMDEIRAAIDGHAAERHRDPNHKCDIEILALVRAYREANSKIQQFWYDMERTFWTGGTVGRLRIEVRRGLTGKPDSRWIHLPSGRILKYYEVHKRRVKKIDPDTGEQGTGTKLQLAYRHIQGYVESTYGGRLTENVTQAVARDLLADALIRLEAAGYVVVGHVHDEALIESKDTEGIREIMRTGPAWAEDLPLDASADVLYRYRKD
jgi:DNA polymerase